MEEHDPVLEFIFIILDDDMLRWEIDELGIHPDLFDHATPTS